VNVISGRVTALQAQKRNRNRVNIYIDGEYSFSLSRLVAAWLVVGQDLSAAKIAQLVENDAYETAYQRALQYLQAQPRTVEQVQVYLSRSAVPDEIIQDVLARLKRAGLIDDAAYAQKWIENRSDFRPRSRRALSRELWQKGVAEDTITAALENVDDDELAYQAAKKYLNKLHNLEWADFRKRMYGFLGRRGFSYDTCSSVTRRVWDEEQENQAAEEKQSRFVDLQIAKEDDT
jgi:regulatory protein